MCIISEYNLMFLVESQLAAHLTCLQCAKTECKDFSVSSQSFTDIFTSSMHHSEEEVSERMSL